MPGHVLVHPRSGAQARGDLWVSCKAALGRPRLPVPDRRLRGVPIRKEPYFGWMPGQLFRAFERRAGWHVLIDAEAPA